MASEGEVYRDHVTSQRDVEGFEKNFDKQESGETV